MYSQVTVYAIMHYCILLKVSPPPLFDLKILAQVFHLTYKAIPMLQKLHCQQKQQQQQKKNDHVKINKDTVFLCSLDVFFCYISWPKHRISSRSY